MIYLFLAFFLTKEERKSLKQTIAMLSIDRRMFFYSVLSGILCLGSSIALAGVSAWLIARASEMPPVLSLQVAAVGVRTFGITRALMRYLQRLSSHKVALDGMDSLRCRLYDQLSTAPSSKIARLQRGDVLYRVGSDVDEVANVVVFSLLPVYVAFFVSLGTVIILGFFSIEAALILGVCLILSGVVAPIFTARSTRQTILLQAKADLEISTRAMSILDSADELRVLGRYDVSLQDFDELTRTYSRARFRASIPRAVAAGIEVFSIGLAVVLTFIVAVPDTTQGMIASVILAVLVLTPLASFEPVSAIHQAVSQLIKSGDSSRRILDLLSNETVPSSEEISHAVDQFSTAKAPKLTKATSTIAICRLTPINLTAVTPTLTAPATSSVLPEQTALPAAMSQTVVSQPHSLSSIALSPIPPGNSMHQPAPLPLVEVSHLTVGWSKPLATLEQLSLSPNSTCCILGPSGVGKTTLLCTLAGLIPALSGEILVEGRNIDELTHQEKTEFFSFTAEDAHIFSTSIKENLRLANPKITQDECMELVSLVGLDQWISGLTQGIDTILGANNTSISGGQKRRLLIARALAHQSQFVLLDEPSEHLDNSALNQIFPRIIAYLKTHNRALVISSHNQFILEHFEQAIWIEPEAEEHYII